MSYTWTDSCSCTCRCLCYLPILFLPHVPNMILATRSKHNLHHQIWFLGSCNAMYGDWEVLLPSVFATCPASVFCVRPSPCFCVLCSPLPPLLCSALATHPASAFCARHSPPPPTSAFCVLRLPFPPTSAFCICGWIDFCVLCFQLARLLRSLFVTLRSVFANCSTSVFCGRSWLPRLLRSLFCFCHPCSTRYYYFCALQ